MKRFAIPIAAFSLVLVTHHSCYAQATEIQPAPTETTVVTPDNTEAEIQESIKGYYAALAKKDKKQVLTYVHPKSPELSGVVAVMDSIFPIATFTYDYTQPKLLCIDEGMAFVRYKHTANLVATAVELNDGRAELDMLDVFKQDGQTWKRWTSSTLASTPKPTGKKIIPTPLPIAGQKFYIEPAAKTIVERAAKLYGSKPKWSGKLKLNTTMSENEVNISYEKPKKLRLELNDTMEHRIITSNGKQVSDWMSFDGDAPEIETSALTQSVDEILLDIASSESKGTGIVPVLVQLLNGKSGLSAAELQERKRNTKTLTVKRLPDALWKGIKCQRVVIDRRLAEANLFENDYRRDEWWFTLEGKLVKVVGYERMNVEKENSGNWNDEISQQDLNPTLGPQTFALSQPKKKK